MMKHGRMKFFMISGLSLLLMLLAIVFIISLWSKVTSGMWIIFGTIVIFAMIALVLTFIVLRKNQNRIKSLPKEYSEVFIDAQEAIGFSIMSVGMKRETIDMVLEIFEHAAMENRDVDEVIGGNLEEFLSDFISGAGGKPSILYWFSYSSALFITYILFIKLYKVVRVGTFSLDNFRTEPLDVGVLITYAMVAYVFFPWMLIVVKKAATGQWKGLKKGLILAPFIIPFGLMGILIGTKSDVMRAFLDHPVAIFNSGLSFIVGILLALGCVGIMKLSQKKQIKDAFKL